MNEVEERKAWLRKKVVEEEKNAAEKAAKEEWIRDTPAREERERKTALAKANEKVRQTCEYIADLLVMFYFLYLLPAFTIMDLKLKYYGPHRFDELEPYIPVLNWLELGVNMFAWFFGERSAVGVYSYFAHWVVMGCVGGAVLFVIFKVWGRRIR